MLTTFRWGFWSLNSLNCTISYCRWSIRNDVRLFAFSFNRATALLLLLRDLRLSPLSFKTTTVLSELFLYILLILWISFVTADLFCLSPEALGRSEFLLISFNSLSNSYRELLEGFELSLFSLDTFWALSLIWWSYSIFSYFGSGEPLSDFDSSFDDFSVGGYNSPEISFSSFLGFAV